MIILSVDPGKMTGFAMWADGKLMLVEQAAMYTFLSWAEETIPFYKPWDLHLVCEKFKIGPQTLSRAADAHWSIGQYEMLQYWADKYDIPFTGQTPSEGKSFSTDEKLKKIDWWYPSPGGHKNDAMRHLLLYLVNKKQFDLRSLI